MSLIFPIILSLYKINNDLFDLIYPVGICVEFATNINPNDVFIGQEWIRDAKGMVTVGVDEEDEDFATVGKCGGKKTHTLTASEMPKHRHYGSKTNWMNWASLDRGVTNRFCVASGGYADLSGIPMTDITGGDQPHNNLQPYITRYKWVRIK